MTLPERVPLGIPTASRIRRKCRSEAESFVLICELKGTLHRACPSLFPAGVPGGGDGAGRSPSAGFLPYVRMEDEGEGTARDWKQRKA